MKYCPRCSKENPDSAKFCASCGTCLNQPLLKPSRRNVVIKKIYSTTYNVTERVEGKLKTFRFVKMLINKIPKNPVLLGISLAVFILFISITIEFLKNNNVEETICARDTITNCQICDGTGYDCESCSYGTCPVCNGNGVIYEVDPSGRLNSQGLPASIPYGCTNCDGTGDCPICNGRSICDACHGTGHNLKYAGDDYCKFCKGDGICPTCQGGGYCIRCDGYGSYVRYYQEPPIRCEECNGSGVCPDNCQNGYCPECTGTGQKIETDQTN